ncbi:hypothetical protein [Hymenobacter canadensis]|uniref:Uncharacterized protein n=1 Tax=Hymenobacter canadensis TaxID=2999067 RepID=A0ABY7LQ12_9BACT|nr:hypothetical protein [Hymenobacter canadensis]WBA41996.1 hypothetical protein O3303_00190 [Hymenobacter canadensis]
MELDDFRRQWKQPVAADFPADLLDADALTQLLARGPSNPVSKMQRNARVEMALTAGLMLLPFAAMRLNKPVTVFWAVLMLLLGAGQLYYYYYKLGVLRRMATVEGNVRDHLRKLCLELRRLLRFLYRVTLVTGPVTLALLFGSEVYQEMGRPGGARVALLAIVAGVLVVLGFLLQLALIRGTRLYLQRLYGQHLDRLEASLRELEDTE